MNCVQTRELLSAYFDNELPYETRLRVAEHLKKCSACTSELDSFRKLSTMADGLPSPAPPESGWSRLEKSLDDDTLVPSPDHSQQWLLPTRRLMAVAAAILVTVGFAWFGYRMWSPQQEYAAVFEHYLEEFQRDPAKAQNMLLTKYPGQAMDAEHVAQKVGYRPAVADGLPEGYSIESTFVMEMPCCTCVQTLCKRSDGSVLVVFEHDDEQADWLGGCPCIMANCGGKEYSLFGLGSQLAASWERGKRHMTIIGARDAREVDKMVSWLD